MEIPTTKALLTNLSLTSQSPLESLRTGQQLYAKIVDQLPNKNEVIIQLGGKLVKVSSSINTSIGQTILVEVEKTKTDIILTVKRADQTSDVVNSALRQALPKQLPIEAFQTPLKALYQTISQTKDLAFIKNLSTDSLKLLAAHIIRTSPSINSMTTAAGIKIAIQNSGIFLEARILQSPFALGLNASGTNNTVNETKHILNNTKINTLLASNSSLVANTGATKVTQVDLKANLVKLIQLLRSWPGQSSINQAQIGIHKSQLLANQNTTLQKKPAHQQINSLLQKLNLQVQDLLIKSEGAVAKITLNQLANSIADTANRQSWQLEVPFYNGQSQEAIFIKIEQKEHHGKTKDIENQWTVSLEMNPPKLGCIKNKLTIDNDNQVSSSFWAEQQETGILIKEHLNVLKERFNSSKLTTKSLEVQTAIEPNYQEDRLTKPILSEKA